MAAVIGAAGGSLTINAVAYRVVEMSATLTQEAVDVSVLGVWHRQFTPGPRTATISATVEADSGGATALAALVKATTSAIAAVAFAYDAAGGDSVAGNCIVTSAQITTSFADREVWAVELQVVGAVT